jgi:hypothetical protein
MKMVGVAIKNIVIYVLLFVLGNISYAQNIKSSINNKFIEPHKANYSILIAGHLYGAPENVQSVYPLSSILGMLHEINSIDCSFFVSLGDNSRTARDIHIVNYKKSFADKLNFPIFNAVGNHDFVNRQKYVENFGETYYDFVYGSELYIFLDSELDHSKIKGEQLKYFRSVIKQKAINPNIKNVFIFTHKLIWAVNIPRYQVLYHNLNSQTGYEHDDKFNSIIIPILKNLAKDKNVFWISGDIGSSWSYPLFYDNDKNTGITFIASGIGDTEKDLILKASINDGIVKFLPISLTGEKLNNIEHYGVKYWLNYFHNDSIVIRYYLKIKKMMLHKYYWMGAFTFISIITIMLLLYYIKKKNAL